MSSVSSFRLRSRRRARGFVELFAALVATLLPYVALRLYLPTNETAGILGQTLLGCFVAAVAGIWVLLSMRRYPGVEATASILPAFSSTFGILFACFLLGRVEHSRVLLISTFVLMVSQFFVIAIREARHLHLRIGVVEQSGARPLQGLWQVLWVPLTDPQAIPDNLDAVTANLQEDLSDDWERTLADLVLAGVPVFHIKHLEESLTGRLELEHLSENSLGTLSPVSAYMNVKHVIDWIIALVALVVLLPLLVCVGVLIRMDSPGPAFFKQQRIGYRGKPFMVFKFRTMIAARPDEDARSGAMTQHGDSRVTRIGAFLRRTRIDEIPQIINVLRGEMSWIGPRPEAEVLSRWYEMEIPFYRYRHIVRPGISGWAQVSQGHVVDVADVTSKLHYDFYYIKNFGAWIDFMIVARTIKTMIFGYGAK